MIQPPSNTVSALAIGSADSTPRSTHHSTGSPSGRPRPRTWSTALLLAGELQLGKVEIGQAGRQLVQTLGHVRQVRETGRHPGAERVLRRGRTAALLLAGLLVL